MFHTQMPLDLHQVRTFIVVIQKWLDKVGSDRTRRYLVSPIEGAPGQNNDWIQIYDWI